MGIGNTKKQAEEAHREIQRLRQQLTTLQAEKARLEGELGRLKKSLDQIAGLWTCPDCGTKAKQGRICPGCGLNHPMQSTNHECAKVTHEPTNGS